MMQRMIMKATLKRIRKVTADSFSVTAKSGRILLNGKNIKIVLISDI